MITHSSKTTETGYDKIRAIGLPLILNNPRRQINKHEAITDDHLAELGLLPATEPPTLADGQKYGEPQLVDEVVNVALIEKTEDDLANDRNNIVSLFKSNMRQVYYINAPEQAQINRALARLSPDEISAIDQWMDKCRQVYDEKKQEMQNAEDTHAVDVSFEHLEFTVNVLVTLANRTILQKMSDYWFR